MQYFNKLEVHNNFHLVNITYTKKLTTLLTIRDLCLQSIFSTTSSQDFISTINKIYYENGNQNDNNQVNGILHLMLKSSDSDPNRKNEQLKVVPDGVSREQARYLQPSNWLPATAASRLSATATLSCRSRPPLSSRPRPPISSQLPATAGFHIHQLLKTQTVMSFRY